MKILPPFNFIDDDTNYRFLLENGFELKFSLKHKIYYEVVRPVLPVIFRKLLQKKVNSNIRYKKDFIDTQFVDIVNKYSNKEDLFNEIYPAGFHSALILTHDIEGEDGFDFVLRVIELEQKYGLRSSWNIVPYKYKIDKGIIREIINLGCEIGIHGYNHDGKLYYSEKIFNERSVFINRAIEEYKAVGFRSPMVHRNLNWLQKLNIKYDASCFDYDPFQPFPGGVGSIWPFIAGKFVELPYTLPQDHTLFYSLKLTSIDIWKNKTKWLYDNRGIILALTHPDYLLEKNYLKLYEEFLEYVISFESLWYCLPKEMSEWWRRKFLY